MRVRRYRDLTKAEKAKIQYVAWWVQAPLALLAYLLTEEQFLLAYNLGISVWTGIVSAKADKDIVEKEDAE